MQIIVKPVRRETYMSKVENDLKSLQALVGGYIEIVRLKNGLLLVCNEEGKLNNSYFNFSTQWDQIFGNVFFCRSNDEGDFISVEPEGFDLIQQWLEHGGW